MGMGCIYNPASTSYRDKISALQGVLKARRNMQRSKPYANDPKWSDALGSSDEIEQAEQTIENSLSVAATDFEKSELTQALEEGLISDNDLREVVAASRRQEMDARRSDNPTDQKTQSDKQS